MAPVATPHRTRPSQCRRGAQHADPNPNPGPGPNPNPSPGPNPHPHPTQANNKYDAEYIRYFAGVDALYIPSYCGYAAKAQYSPTVLFARNHNNPRALFAGAHAAARAATAAPAAGAGGGGTLAGGAVRFERTEDTYPYPYTYP
eukprot:scaffold82613_cov39-Phaeocystis_antarctica.AAC.2